MKLIPKKLPNRIRVYIQEIESGVTKKGKPGTETKQSRTYQFEEISYADFIKRFETWIKSQT